MGTGSDVRVLRLASPCRVAGVQK